MRICFPLLSTITFDEIEWGNEFTRGLSENLELCYLKRYLLSQKELDDLDIAVADSNREVQVEAVLKDNTH